MFKMESHDPFGYLKHKLWPKERPGVKFSIWLSTIKSQKSPWFICVQVICNITLKSPWQGLQLFFKPHLNRRSAQKVMGLQSHGSPNSKNFGVQGQNDIWLLASWLGIENTIRGKVVASPKSGLWWVLWVRVCLWFICAPKVLQLCTNQLVRFVHVRVNNWPTCHLSLSHLGWRIPNSSKDSNVSPSERQRKKEESGHTP
jgi:hypothetical protein